MSKDAFELLREANPLPDDPPPLPIAPLMERVGQEPGGLPRATKRRPRVRFALVSVVAAGAVAAFALTGSIVAPKKGMDPARTSSRPSMSSPRAPRRTS